MSPICYLAIFSLALASLSPAAALAVPGNSGVAVPPPTVPTSRQFLQAHNEARAAVGVPPLTWNATLLLDALRYSKELRIGCKARPLTAWGTDGIYGRNLFKGFGSRSAADAAAAWVGERRWYDRGANTCAPGQICGAYTQVVWRGTRHLGCARYTCRNGVDTVAVCEYYPPGNVAGERPY